MKTTTIVRSTAKIARYNFTTKLNLAQFYVMILEINLQNMHRFTSLLEKMFYAVFEKRFLKFNGFFMTKLICKTF